MSFSSEVKKELCAVQCFDREMLKAELYGLLLFGKTYNNRLVLHVGSNSFFSLPLEQPMTAFTRVVVTYNHESKAVRFYAGTQELTITGELADELGSDDSAQSIIGELKAMLSETAGMTDDEIRETIRGIADEHNVRLTETQVQQLLDLCRALEKLDPERLSQSAEDAKNTLQKMEDAKEKVGGFLQTVKRAFESVKSLFEKLAELTGRKS